MLVFIGTNTVGLIFCVYFLKYPAAFILNILYNVIKIKGETEINKTWNSRCWVMSIRQEVLSWNCIKMWIY